MSDHHGHLKRMALVASNEDEDALLWVLAEIERLRMLLSDTRSYLMGRPWQHPESPDETIRRALEGK